MRTSIKLLLLVFILPVLAKAQVGGDYRSIASGAWSTAANWEKFNGTTLVWAATTSAPTSTANVTIQAGDTMVISATSNSFTLLVEPNAAIVSDGLGQRGLRVYGSSLINNGTIGGNYGADSINLEIMGNGATCTISGTGLTKVNRLRAYYALVGTNIVFDQNVIFNNTSGTGGSAVGLSGYYNSSSGTTATENITCTISSGRTVTMTNGAALHFTNTVTSNTGGTYTYNVNGTLDMSTSWGTSVFAPNSNNAASLLKLNVAGLIKIGAGFSTLSTGSGSTPGTVQLNIASGGIVDASATSSLTTGTTAFVAADGTAVMKRIVAATDTVFPLAVATNGWNAATLNNAGTTDTFIVKLKNSFDADIALSDPTKVVTRQWTINDAITGGNNLSAKLSWLTADQGTTFNPSGTVNIYVIDGSGIQTIYPATVSGAGTLANPYTATATGITTLGRFFVGNSGIAAPSNHLPVFTGGSTQSLSVCINASATSVNSLLAVTDLDAAQTETWSLLTPAIHGTAVAAYTVTSTGSTLTPSGLTYTPTSGYTGTDSFFVKVSDGTDADTIKIVVTVNPAPVAATISGAASLCEGSSITLSATVTGGTWSATNTSATVSAVGVVSGTFVGVDTIIYTITNTCGSAATNYTITVNPSAGGAGIISGGSSVCTAGTLTLTSTISGGIWSVSNAHATIDPSGVVTAITTGLDTVTYSITGSCGTYSSYYIVTVNAAPTTPTISGTSGICVGASITLSSTTTGGTWTASNPNATVSATGIVTGSTPGTDTITYTITNTCGSASATANISIDPLPDAGMITGLDQVCTGSTITLSNTATGGIWSSSNATASVSATGVVTGNTVGSDTIRYTVTSACGTSAVTTLHVTINALPAPAIISGLDTLCQGEITTLTASATGGLWSSTNPLIAIASTSGVVGGVTPGTDSIVYTLTNSCGSVTTTKKLVVLSISDCNATGIIGISKNDARLSIYPNPNQGSFSLLLNTASGEDATIEITNMLGSSVKKMEVKTNTTVSVQLDLPAGIYILTANTATGRFTQRITIQ